MTTSNGRSKETRRSSRSAGQWLLGLLIVLAIVASILMVFADNLSIVGTLAVIAALWAAVIGAILVTRFRKQAETAEAKSRDLRLVYELQLEREIAARRQYELDVEASIRRDVSAEATQELADLKSQVLSLRASLEQLLGGPLPEERVALPNEKLRELASGLGGAGFGSSGLSDAERYASGLGADGGFGATSGFGTHDDGIVAARDFAATAPSPESGRHAPREANPNEMTEVIPVVADDDAPLSGRIATEVPDPGPTANTGSPDEIGDTFVSETVVETTVTEYGTDARPRGAHERTASSPSSASGSMSTPFSGGFYGAGAYPGNTASQTTGAASDTGTGATSYVDETPTDEWASGTGANGSGQTAAGRHGGPDASSSGRRRRPDADDTDADSAHSAGLPVAELLNQLRRTESGAVGRRRRGD